jgi:hypothetical protein
MPGPVLSLITNPETIAVNQNSSGNRQAFREDGKAAWIADDPESGGKYVALFNLSDSVRMVDLDLESESMAGKYKARDLWKREDMGIFEKTFGVALEPHGAGMYRLEMITRYNRIK